MRAPPRVSSETFQQLPDVSISSATGLTQNKGRNQTSTEVQEEAFLEEQEEEEEEEEEKL